MSFRLCLLDLLGILSAAACAPNRNVPVEAPRSSDPLPGTKSENLRAPPTRSSGAAGSHNPGVAENEPALADHSDIEVMLRQEYSRWLGTRHRLGGNDRNGVDCSGFVQAVYRNIFRIDLPRTTGEQVRQGHPVAFHQMRLGDLVFFTPPDDPRHVGIYLGDSQFVHASKTSGVTVSPIDRSYWKPHFWKARRILID
jgi:cell wall-associated NlpC family hydrolase